MILKLHNDFRRDVNPPAKNMEQMVNNEINPNKHVGEL